MSRLKEEKQSEKGGRELYSPSFSKNGTEKDGDTQG